MDHTYAMFALVGAFAICVALMCCVIYRSFILWRDSKPRRD